MVTRKPDPAVCFSHEGKTLRHLASMPFIYAMVLPLLAFDVFLELYHRACFPLYGLLYVERGAYFRIDRETLPYLTFMQKLNCAYCTYANGLVHYAAAITAQTERYWCPIKHRAAGGFRAPPHHESFLEYGDEQAWKDLGR